MIDERVVITWIDEPKLLQRIFRNKEMRCGVIRESFPNGVPQWDSDPPHSTVRLYSVVKELTSVLYTAPEAGF